MNLHNVREPLSVQDAGIRNSSFTKVNLAQSRFDDVNLQDTTFTNVKLSGVVFDDVNLTNASISNANLTGMRVNGILIDDMMRAYRSRAAATPSSGAVVYAKDRPRLQRFYQNAIGFELQHEADGHAVLISPAFQLVLVDIPAHIASSIAIDSPPRLRAETPIKLIFPATSIATVRAKAREHGGDVLPPEREWDFDGGCVCDGSDPEGNVFQLRENPSPTI